MRSIHRRAEVRNSRKLSSLTWPHGLEGLVRRQVAAGSVGPRERTAVGAAVAVLVAERPSVSPEPLPKAWASSSVKCRLTACEKRWYHAGWTAWRIDRCRRSYKVSSAP